MHIACLLASSLAAAAAASSSSSSSSSSTLITLSLPPAPNPFALAPGTHATLSALGARYSAPLSSLNTFVFRNVSPGSYLADVHCPSDAFRPLRIDVDADGRVHAWDTYRGNDWGNKGEVASKTSSNNAAAQDVVVEVKSLGKKLYYMERPAFSVLSILKNPMILMGLVSMLIFFGMPKLMENMDPEMKAEFEAQQRKSPLNAVMGGGGGGSGGAQANPLGNFDMAAFLAGSKQKDTASSGAAPDARNEAVRR
ncbi:hypothetical protein AAL_04086 [Moelleriella libera RCEF 2490]|uniref:ER membrane protein complex subunit 7 beta-sandwich domain-containing protein n=1 Tax=Moelleriella libera RCEF 2490 TaxID=1081109 RepID=A0A168CPF4_9HYPO|nr:hypothetical protein AAL_04086 [Moelleriella libera RCEF 2490]